MEHTTIEQPIALKKAWEGIRQAKPGIRIRNAAAELGVSEAELIATTVGEGSIRLKGDWPALVQRLPELGYVMSLTRNESCVLEHKGTFQKVSTFGSGQQAMGTVVGPIETRIFFKAWHIGFAVRQETHKGTLESIQIFDHAGEAITKIYLQEKSDYAAYQQLIADFRSADQSSVQQVEPYTAETFTQNIDASALLSDWSAMQDTHEFYGMLRKHGVQRFHAFELARNQFAYPIQKTSIRQLLEKAAATHLPIMIFAGNRGNLQIHQGKIKTVRIMNEWLNVLDPEFNMHLREDHIAYVWVVRKPTKDGHVTAVEAFDKNRELIVRFFGLRKPGIPELAEWRTLVADLPRI